MLFWGLLLLISFGHAETLQPSTALKVTFPAGLKGSCSAAVIAEGDERYLVTAAHCLLDRSAKASLIFTAADKSETFLISRGHIFDAVDVFAIPLTKFELTWIRTLRLRTSELQPGEDIFPLGFPEGIGPRRTSCVNNGGTLGRDHSRLRALNQMLCQDNGIAEFQGISGGPVIDSDGNYVGMIDAVSTYKPDRLTTFCYFVPSRVLRLAPSATGELEPAAYKIGFNFSDFNAQAQFGAHLQVHLNYTRDQDGNFQPASVDLRSETLEAHVPLDGEIRKPRLVTLTWTKLKLTLPPIEVDYRFGSYQEILWMIGFNKPQP